ncbi:selenide, water dikinase SelD [Anaerococcus sp. AGMB00486]|uniref:Selenide, water dikinase n=1 Tax=Anaerococcus faecalis TaxID=2742993 RepID=A0ABX2NCY8_9FIRM|nr:selenide, water dikinase SelD [Anaerococcus faecalis]NVF12327.1 selenide, water dikinase SelD [Anaerococcus faecalis]
MTNIKLEVCGGCNAKIPQESLETTLSSINNYKRDDILVGFDTMDDAAVIKIDEENGVVSTMDFFPPMVEDAFSFGQIACANALSDIYAMGAEPIAGLNIVLFPEDYNLEILREILRGGADKMIEAKASLVGGHSIHDPKIKYGLSITGKVDIKKLWRNNTVKKNDVLILTKPLGVTLVTNAYSVGILGKEELNKAIASMTYLNKYAKEIFEKYRISAATDVTGFGFLGHLGEMLSDKFTAIIDSSKIPILDGAYKAASEFIFTKGGQRNRMYFEDRVEFLKDDFVLEEILFDPQTSGGLLVSINEDDAKCAIKELRNFGIDANIIGKIYNKYDKSVFIE